MRTSACSPVAFALLALLPAAAWAADTLPFQHKVETYRDKQGDVIVFAVRLEQPFLAEEFERNSYLRLHATDDRAHLIYPKQTKFEQKHAEFYGRLRGEGKLKLKLSYETVAENLDGTRRVETKQGEIEVAIPTEPTGARQLFTDWANQQNRYFAELLQYYPEETFYQYCLLQSKARYDVTPPPLPQTAVDKAALETDLYYFASGSLAIQESLQRDILSGGARVGDLSIPVASLSPPQVRSLPYRDLLDEKRTREKTEPTLHELAKLVPEDQYFLHFHSLSALGDLHDLASDWAAGPVRLFTVRAQDANLQAKLEEQLCLRRGPLTKLFGDAAISEIALTGADPFVLEGTDVTVLLRLKRPEVFRTAAAAWLAETRQRHPDLVDREFNYRGHKVKTHYTGDRVVSAFVVEHGDVIVYSTSHRAIRHLIDAATGAVPNLYDALDYRYATTILPPRPGAEAGYFFGSEAMIRRLVGPAAKISEKRRVQCFNNLVMLNNASLFFRLEYGRSPKSLSELVEQRFVDADKVVCPHGGAYAFDPQSDACTCSLHNRLRYLTPNCELNVLNVSREEAAQYDRYRQRYAAFWQKAFDPIAMRITMGQRTRFEMCVLPLANGSLYEDLRRNLAEKPRPLGTAQFAPSAVVSLAAVPGRQRVAEILKSVPGVAEVLRTDPALADMKWVGDRVGLHYCDGETVLELDPTVLKALNAPLIGNVPVQTQAAVAALLSAVDLPVYVTFDVENRDAAARLLKALAQQVFLKKEKLLELPTTLDGYRLPDYKDHAIYVFSGQVYALKVRLHVAVVGDQLVAATKADVLRQVIDAAAAPADAAAADAHVLLRLNRRALLRLRDGVELNWAEKSRVACHHNIPAIYNLCKLYGTPVEQVPRLANAKYGVTYFCPEGGQYRFDADRDEVFCTVHGNRVASRQLPRADQKSSLAQFLTGVDEVVATLRFQSDALIATVDVVRSPPAGK